MEDIGQAFALAARLVASGDGELMGIVLLSLRVSLTATALAFGGASLVLSAIPAAAAGLALYALILIAMRELGLAQAWQYVRALH